MRIEQGGTLVWCELRCALQALKTNAGIYVKQSSKTQQSMGKLTDALGILRALKSCGST